MTRSTDWKRKALVLAGTTLLAVVATAAPPATLPAAMQTAAKEALAKGAAYLRDSQEDNGAWGELPHPATAAMCATALKNAPGDNAKTIDAAMAFVLGYRQPDGSIYPAGSGKNASANYPNYTTCISLLAMSIIDKPEYYPEILKARAYVIGAQFKDPDAPDYGGLGYGHSGRADLSNAGWASEALYYSARFEQQDGKTAARDSEAWNRFAAFLTACQNLPQTNNSDRVSADPRDLGGFAYMPTDSKAGTREDSKDGVGNLVSSGSMSYAGLKSMIYARLPANDARVKGAYAYACRNFTLDENPGMSHQAYYFYLYAMTRALDAYGVETLTLANGETVAWRPAMASKLLSLQQEDGSWWNTKDARYMESMPELVTPYVMLSLEVALALMPPQ